MTDLGTFAMAAAEVLSPAVGAAAVALGTRLAALMNAAATREAFLASMSAIDRAVADVVRELQQVSVDTLKAASPDGRLAENVKAMLRRAALAGVDRHLGDRGLEQLRARLGLDEQDTDAFIVSRIESAVYQLRAAARSRSRR